MSPNLPRKRKWAEWKPFYQLKRRRPLLARTHRRTEPGIEQIQSARGAEKVGGAVEVSPAGAAASTPGPAPTAAKSVTESSRTTYKTTGMMGATLAASESKAAAATVVVGSTVAASVAATGGGAAAVVRRFRGCNKHRGALRGTPGSVCPQPEPNATELTSCAPISARTAQRQGGGGGGVARRERAPVGPGSPSPAPRLLWNFLHSALRRVVHVPVLHVSPRGRHGGLASGSPRAAAYLF